MCNFIITLSKIKSLSKGRLKLKFSISLEWVKCKLGLYPFCNWDGQMNPTSNVNVPKDGGSFSCGHDWNLTLMSNFALWWGLSFGWSTNFWYHKPSFSFKVSCCWGKLPHLHSIFLAFVNLGLSKTSSTQYRCASCLRPWHSKNWHPFGTIHFRTKHRK